jgi:heterotetrameric sarcosine oxidase gamma subunit
VPEDRVTLAELVARSPIPPAGPVRIEAGWEVSGIRSDAALTSTYCTPLAKVHVRAPGNGTFAKALGVPFGRAGRAVAGTLAGAGLLVGAGPGEWLLLAPPGTAGTVAGHLADLAAGSAPDEFVSVIDLTHGRALVRVTGARSADVLARLCPVDLDGEMTPDGTAFRSAVAGVATDVVRDDRDGTISYLLHCERSCGRYLFGALLDAGGELGIAVDGFTAAGI